MGSFLRCSLFPPLLAVLLSQTQGNDSAPDSSVALETSKEELLKLLAEQRAQDREHASHLESLQTKLDEERAKSHKQDAEIERLKTELQGRLQAELVKLKTTFSDPCPNAADLRIANVRLRYELADTQEKSVVAEGACRRNAAAAMAEETERSLAKLTECQAAVADSAMRTSELVERLNATQIVADTATDHRQRADVCESNLTAKTLEFDQSRSEIVSLQAEVARLRVAEKAAKSTSERLARHMTQRSSTTDSVVSADGVEQETVPNTETEAEGDVQTFVQAVSAAEAETERLRDLLADAEIRCSPGLEEPALSDTSDSALSSWSILADSFQFDNFRDKVNAGFNSALSWSGTTVGTCWQKCLQGPQDAAGPAVQKTL